MDRRTKIAKMVAFSAFVAIYSLVLHTMPLRSHLPASHGYSYHWNSHGIQNLAENRIRELTMSKAFEDELKSTTSSIPTRFLVNITYDSCTCTIEVESEETILSALERAKACLAYDFPPSCVPFDCRRGNCLTCAAKIVHNPTTSTIPSTPLLQTNDGLSPAMSRQLQSWGCVLTCCSYVTGHGLHLELNANRDVWKHVYQWQLANDPAIQSISRAALARTVRKSAERNIDRWIMETEQSFHVSSQLKFNNNRTD
jgi:ferredoxin